MSNIDNDFIGVVTHAAMRRCSRRGMLSFLGRSGLVATAAIAGLKPVTEAFACQPGAYCNGGCYACCSSCSLFNRTCTCTCPSCNCAPSGCNYAHGYYSNNCSFLCNCPGCGVVCLPGSPC